MKEEWFNKPLDNLVTVVSGFSFKSSDFSEKNPTKCIKITNVGVKEFVADSSRKLPSEFVKEYSRFKIPEGAIVIALTRSIISSGLKVALVPEQFDGALLNQRVAALKVDTGSIQCQYLFYFLCTHGVTEYVLKKANTLMQPNLSISDLRKLAVPFPSKEEQKRIVAILDEAFAGISLAVANVEKNLANARELFESYLNNIFTQKGEGWVLKILDDVSFISSKLVDPRELENQDLPYIGAGNIVSFTGELVGIKTAREEGLISGKFFFDREMVLYSKIRPYLMKTCRPGFDGLCSADIYPLSVKMGVLERDFLYYMLMSQHFTEYAIAGSARAGMPKVNRKHLFNYQLSLPNIEEQKRISEKLDRLFFEKSRLETIYRQKLTALNELKQSILHKAFTGELTQRAEHV